MTKTLLSILTAAVVTYLVRALPLTLIRQPIRSQFLRSFLYYVPYVTLAVMTFPAILSASDSMVAATVGFLVALVLAWLRKSLFFVSVSACAVVYILELLMSI